MDLRTGVCPICGHHEASKRCRTSSASATTAPCSWRSTHRTDGIASKMRQHPVGMLMLYVCRKCGYTQWFAKSPEKIPIGDEYQTKLIVGRPSQGPFR